MHFYETFVFEVSLEVYESNKVFLYCLVFNVVKLLEKHEALYVLKRAGK